MTIKEIQQDIIDDFELFDDWMEKYDYIIELGKTINLIDDKYKTDKYLIKGCQSQVWLHAELIDGKVIYKADGDAIITKGILAILFKVLSNQSPKDIINAEMTFLDDIGLKEHLSPTRANGLLASLKMMKLYATALNTKS